ncbi:MAG: group 1 glycosyl [Geobacteraceae bacterium]|nr:MAG: group 1 glycosyl [Geobacteraceae bacterium]
MKTESYNKKDMGELVIAKKISVLFLMDSLRFGGAERQTIDLVNGLDASLFDITLCYFRNETHLKDNVEENRIAGMHCLMKKGRFDIGLFARLKSVIDESKPQIVFCVNTYPLIFVHLLRLCFAFRYRIIQVMHTTFFPSKYSDLLMKFIFAPLANRSESVIFVCRNQMQYWMERYGILPAKSQYIYNGVDEKHFAAALSPEELLGWRKRLGIADNDAVVCICAALRTEKRQVDLVSAGKMLLDKGIAIKILIVGDGIERNNIENHIRAVGMADHVVMAGFQKEVRPYIAISDMIVIASDAETFSMAILEAMALGKAIIASDVGGTSEQVMNGVNGFLFSPGNVAELADKIEYVIRNKLSDALGVESRKIVREKYTINMMIDRYSQLIMDTIE